MRISIVNQHDEENEAFLEKYRDTMLTNSQVLIKLRMDNKDVHRRHAHLIEIWHGQMSDIHDSDPVHTFHRNRCDHLVEQFKLIDKFRKFHRVQDHSTIP